MYETLWEFVGEHHKDEVKRTLNLLKSEYRDMICEQVLAHVRGGRYEDFGSAVMQNIYNKIVRIIEHREATECARFTNQQEKQ